MAVDVGRGLARLQDITANGSPITAISVGDQLVWEPTSDNSQVPYTVPFLVQGTGLATQPPAMNLTEVTSSSLSVAASGKPNETGFGSVAGYNFYRGGIKQNASPVTDGLYTFSGLTEGTAYTLKFTFVNGSGTESAKYGDLTASTMNVSQELPQATRDSIDGFVAAALKPNTKVDGCLVGIKSPWGDFEKAYGGDRTPGMALTTAHWMRYGSVTKMYTALLILRQIDLGHLSFDDKVSQFVSGPGYWDEITVKQLLMMQSGIEDYLQQDAAVQQTYFLSPTAAFDAMSHILGYTRLFAPGAQSSYSNSNYVLLGKILEWCDAQYGTSRDIRTIINEDLLGPLGLVATEWPTGLTTTHYSRGWADNLALPQIQAILGPLAPLAGLLGYPTTEEVEFTAVHPSYAGAAGVLDGTIGDLVKFGEAIGSGALLSPEMRQLRDETFVTYLTYTPANPWEGPGWMGFGLGVIQWGQWLGWIGNLAGYHSVLFANPVSGVVIAVLMNHMSADPLTVFYKIAYLLDPDSTLAAEQKIRVAGPVPSSAAVRTPGVYVWHAPGDPDGNTVVPLKVPFYV